MYTVITIYKYISYVREFSFLYWTDLDCLYSVSVHAFLAVSITLDRIVIKLDTLRAWNTNRCTKNGSNHHQVLNVWYIRFKMQHPPSPLPDHLHASYNWTRSWSERARGAKGALQSVVRRQRTRRLLGIQMSYLGYLQRVIHCCHQYVCSTEDISTFY